MGKYNHPARLSRVLEGDGCFESMVARSFVCTARITSTLVVQTASSNWRPAQRYIGMRNAGALCPP